VSHNLELRICLSVLICSDPFRTRVRAAACFATRVGVPEVVGENTCSGMLSESQFVIGQVLKSEVQPNPAIVS